MRCWRHYLSGARCKWLAWSSWCHCHPIISCFIKIEIGLNFLVPAYPGCPVKEAVKRVLSACQCTWGSDRHRRNDRKTSHPHFGFSTVKLYQKKLEISLRYESCLHGSASCFKANSQSNWNGQISTPIFKVWPNTTKVGSLTHIVSLTVLTVKILKFYKLKMVAVPILSKIEKLLVWLIFIILHLLFYRIKPQIL